MAPTRVGLVGLSSKPVNNQAPGSWAAAAHLGTYATTPEYEVVAVCNSTAESARRAIEFHELPPTTKAYGSPEDLAADPDVDLVVVSVRIEKHRELTVPALLKKKQVFVEWPLGASLAEAEELTKLAENAGVKSIVGLQSRADAEVLKIKELISTGKIGRIVSSSVLASSSSLPVQAWMEGAEYYLDMSSGGNEYTIWFGHFLDSFIDVLGDFTDLSAILHSDHPAIPVFSAEGKLVNPGYRKTSPENILVQGKLEGGVLASITVRKPQSPVDGLGFRWIITGTEGEIEMTQPDFHWQMSHPGRKLRMRIGKSEQLEEIDMGKAPASKVTGDPLPQLVRNVAGIYEAFAKDDETRYASFQSALRTHRLLDRIVVAAKYNPEA